jgi:hypothetical protein
MPAHPKRELVQHRVAAEPSPTPGSVLAWSVDKGRAHDPGHESPGWIGATMAAHQPHPRAPNLSRAALKRDRGSVPVGARSAWWSKRPLA